MRSWQAHSIVLASVLTLAWGSAWASSAALASSAARAAEPAPAGPAAPAAPSTPSTPVARPAPPTPSEPTGNEPRVERRVAEDDHVRVEELRVRGESRQITVQPKMPGARPYEIVPPSGAHDPSQRGRQAPGASRWRVLSF